MVGGGVVWSLVVMMVGGVVNSVPVDESMPAVVLVCVVDVGDVAGDGMAVRTEKGRHR